MIDFRISARDRRVLVFGSMAIGSLVAVTRGVPTLRGWERRKRAEATAVAADLARVRQSRRVLPALRDSLVARRARLLAIESSLLMGFTPSAAAAQLAAAVETIARDSRVKISSLQLYADSAQLGRMAYVRVRVLATSDVGGLVAFLRGVESGPITLVVRELAIAQPDPVGAESKPEALRIDVLVEAIAIVRREATA